MKKIDTTIIGIITTQKGDKVYSEEVWGFAYQVDKKRSDKSDNSFGKLEIKNKEMSKKDFITVCRQSEIPIINVLTYIK